MEYNSEKQVVADILHNLAQLNAYHPVHKGKIFVWRNNTGVDQIDDPSRRQGKRYVSYGKKGSSDILGSFHGHFLAIEAKYGKNKPTVEQAEFLNQVIETGGLAFVAYSWADVERELLP